MKQLSIRQKFVFEAKDEFLQFLIREKVLEEYLTLLNSKLFISFEIFVCYPESYISSGFPWITTEQGFNFWENLHDKWIDKWIKVLTTNKQAKQKYDSR